MAGPERTIPRDPLPESSLAMLLHGYEFISRRCRRFGSEIFQARLLLQPTICMRGSGWAEVFYNHPNLRRAGAPPARMLKARSGFVITEVESLPAHAGVSPAGTI